MLLQSGRWNNTASSAICGRSAEARYAQSSSARLRLNRVSEIHERDEDQSATARRALRLSSTAKFTARHHTGDILAPHRAGSERRCSPTPSSPLIESNSFTTNPLFLKNPRIPPLYVSRQGPTLRCPLRLHFAPVGVSGRLGCTKPHPFATSRGISAHGVR
jgi:hypothetical protein